MGDALKEDQKPLWAFVLKFPGRLWTIYGLCKGCGFVLKFAR